MPHTIYKDTAWLLTIVVLLCPNGLHGKRSQRYVINYSSLVKTCPDDTSGKFIDTSGLRAVRYNESIGVLAGPFEFKKEIKDPFRLDVILERVLPTGTKEVLLSHSVPDFCTKVKQRNEDTIYGQYMRKINFTDCPLAPGQYFIDSMVADSKELKIDPAMEGVYTITFTFYSFIPGKGLVQVPEIVREACLKFDCAVEPA